MKITAVVPVAALALSFVDPSQAGIGQVFRLGARAVGGIVEEATDNNSRRSFDENVDTNNFADLEDQVPQAQVHARDSNAQNADLPEPAASICQNQLKGKHVKFSVSKNNDVTIKGVPPACMTLATVFLNDHPDGGAPVPMGKLWPQRHLDAIVKQDSG